MSRLDDVALAQRGDRPADERLGGDVAGHEAARRAAEAAVREQRDALAEPLADERRGHAEHLAHAGAALRAFVADDDDVAGVDLAVRDRLEGVLLAVEDARRAAMLQALVTGDLHDAAVGREVALQDDEAARRLQRLVDRQDDVLAGRLLGVARTPRRGCGR